MALPWENKGNQQWCTYLFYFSQKPSVYLAKNLGNLVIELRMPFFLVKFFSNKPALNILAKQILQIAAPASVLVTAKCWHAKNTPLDGIN